MLVHIKQIVKYAQSKKIAIGAFNTYNLESTLAIIRAAAQSKSPAIIQISEATIKYAGLRTILEIIRTVVAAEAKQIPLAIHLDHGKDYDLFKECVLAGLTSVHLDGSALPYAANVAITKKAVKFGHQHGAWVQGELGAILGKEGMTKVILPPDHNSYMTDPVQAGDFVRLTGVDTLATSIGTMHGNFAGQEKIDFPRLQKIRKLVKIPLVLHGASGTKDSEIRRAIDYGIRIINIDTDLRLAFTKTLQQTLKGKITFYDPRKILAPALNAVQQEVEDKIKLFKKK